MLVTLMEVYDQETEIMDYLLITRRTELMYRRLCSISQLQRVEKMNQTFSGLAQKTSF